MCVHQTTNLEFRHSYGGVVIHGAGGGVGTEERPLRNINATILETINTIDMTSDQPKE